MDRRTERPAWLRYGIAVAVSVLAAAIVVRSQLWLDPPPLAPFYGAVAVALWFGGLGPALLAVALTSSVVWTEGFPPYGTLILGWQDLTRVISYVIIALLIVFLGTSRDQAYAALRASERRFRAMLETANEGIWLIDPRARTEYVNDRMAALLDTSPQRIATGSVLDYVFPEDEAAAREWIAHIMDGRAEEFDFRFRRADGEEVLVRAGTSPMRDGSGRVVGALGLFTDVTHRRRAEDALRLLNDVGRALASSLDYEETLQRVVWAAVPAIADCCIVDLRDERGDLRRVAVALAGPDQPDLVASARQQRRLSGVAGPVAEVMRTGTSLFVARMTDAFHLASQDPEHLEVLRDLGAISVIVAPLRAGGVVHGVMTFATTSASGRHFVRDDLDLAEQLARRAALAIQNARLYRDAHAAEARYRGLFEGTMDGIIVVAPDGSCVDANPAMCAMIGYDRDELIGRPSPLAACGGPWTGEAGEQLRHEGRWWGEFELPRRDRPPVPVESWITAVQLSTGPVYVGVVRDVSERRRFERMQEEFLSALAHDLKNPLTAVHGQTQLLQRRLTRGQLPDAARLADRLAGIDAAVAQMTALLDELTDITRLRAGQEIELRRAPTDLVALARRTIEGQERIAGRHTVAMRTDLSELVGFWDGPRLERVLSNLLGNAIKYSPRGGPITVAIAREDADGAAAAVLSVTDQGVGIPASDLDLIFERYRRAGNVESFAGSGIGLSGAKRIVELHGGTIAVTSTEGVGSTFTVRIPIEGNARP